MIPIGFGHRKRMGKDTAAKIAVDILRQKYPKKKIALAHFADKIKQIAYDIYKWAGVKPAGYYEQYPDERNRVLPDLGITVREVWIRIGTPCFRDTIYQDTWVRNLLHDFNSFDFVVIPDLRFPNEMDHVKRNGLTIRVHRDTVPVSDDVADCALAGFVDWDHQLTNLTLTETRTELEKILEHI